MAFRADQTSEGRDHAVRYLTNNLPAADRTRSIEEVYNLIDQFGPVVDHYPSWHPILTSSNYRKSDGFQPQTYPGQNSGYEGLDHTICFRNAFVTCPYADGSKVLRSVAALNHSIAAITATPLNVPLYSPNAVPILVKCEWKKPLELDGTIPKRLAVPLFLEQELPCWLASEVGETWDFIRPYALGKPRGSRSSYFVNQEAGQALKTVWTTLVNTGMFGPILIR